jgi:multiple sugar transport system ATP-binding protein
MGMETMVYFAVNGKEVCGRVDPARSGGPGQNVQLQADLAHMQLIDPLSGAVL